MSCLTKQDLVAATSNSPWTANIIFELTEFSNYSLSLSYSLDQANPKKKSCLTPTQISAMKNILNNAESPSSSLDVSQ